MLGIKPFQGVKNNEVIRKLENGERLALPDRCPPRLYSLMSQCWSYEPSKRPTFKDIRENLQYVLFLIIIGCYYKNNNSDNCLIFWVFSLIFYRIKKNLVP